MQAKIVLTSWPLSRPPCPGVLSNAPPVADDNTRDEKRRIIARKNAAEYLLAQVDTIIMRCLVRYRMIKSLT